MRSSFARSFGPAVVTGLLALASAGSAIAEDAEFENVSTDGSQIVAAGATPDVKQTKNLNTVPDDGLGPEAPKGPYNRLVRELLAARPGEDLVICVAGCYSNRDRVVYAQPIEKSALAPTLGGPRAPQQNISAVQPGDGASVPAKADVPGAVTTPQANVTPSFDPHAPAILNGSSDGTAGTAPDHSTPPPNGETN